MSTVLVNSDVGKFARLHEEQAQLERQGSLTPKQLEWFLGLTPEQRMLVSNASAHSFMTDGERLTWKFVEIDCLEIVVPDDYVHATQLTSFCEEHRDFPIHDEDCPSPSCVLEPGARFYVRVYEQDRSVPTTTSAERLAFLAALNAQLVGVQGLTLLFEQKGHLLSNGCRYVSYDVPDRLPSKNGKVVLPSVHTRWVKSDGYKFHLHEFDGGWNLQHVMLAFLADRRATTLVAVP